MVPTKRSTASGDESAITVAIFFPSNLESDLSQKFKNGVCLEGMT